MKRYNKWFTYLKGAKWFIAVLLVILLVFIGSIIWSESKISNTQIQNIYEQENNRLSVVFEKEIGKCMNVARSMTVTKITPLPENYTPDEYERYYLEIKQITAVMTISDQIVGVKLKYGDEYVIQNDAGKWQEEQIPNATLTCDYARNTQLLFFEDEPKYLYMRYVPVGATIGAEEVLMKLSLVALSENCVPNISDEIKSYVTLEDGTILMAASFREIGKKIHELYQDGSQWNLSEMASENGIAVFSALSSDYYANYTHKSLAIGGALGFFFMILVVALIYVYYLFFVRPIENILHLINLETDKNEYDRDVLQYISTYIDRIHGENKVLDEKVQQILKELKLQQVLSSQMQIKPHFLSNTLSAISWMAVEKYDSVDNPISDSLTILSDIFYSTLSTDEILVTVNQEKRETEKYIEILKIRYGSELNVEWKIDRSLENEVILKTSIQPLVENCIGHAFSSMTDGKKISISVQSGQECIVVSVTDNGVGIAPDKLNQLEKAINDFTVPAKRHIGLRNINQRIKLLYGEEYGLHIESVLGKYTRCYFEYPKHKENHVEKA